MIHIYGNEFVQYIYSLYTGNKSEVVSVSRRRVETEQMPKGLDSPEHGCIPGDARVLWKTIAFLNVTKKAQNGKLTRTKVDEKRRESRKNIK